MPLFSVMRRGQQPVVVDAPNWIVAMGEGIPKLSGAVAIDRLACEMLPNGTVIARDVRTGMGYVILPLADTSEEQGSGQTQVNDILEEAGEPSEPIEDVELGEMELEDELDGELAELASTRLASDAWALAIRLLAEAVPCEAATAVEATPRAGLLFASVIGPDAPKLRALRLPYGAGFVGVSVDRGMALRVNDVQQDSRHYAAVDEATGFETRSILCVPVVDDGICFGCLELINATDGRFSRADGDQAERVAQALSERLAKSDVQGRTLQR